MFTFTLCFSSITKSDDGYLVAECCHFLQFRYSRQKSFVDFRRQLLGDVFSNNRLMKLGRKKQGSYVIELSIKVADYRQLEELTNRICQGRGGMLRKLVWDDFGNFVLGTLFDRCDLQLREVLAESVQRNVMWKNSAETRNLYEKSRFIRDCAHFRWNRGMNGY